MTGPQNRGKIIPLVVGDKTLYRLLILEKARKKDSGLRWEDYFPLSELKNLLDKYDSVQQHFSQPGMADDAAQRLKTLFDERNDSGRHSRARNGIRALYLLNLSILLLIPLIFFFLGPEEIDQLSPSDTWAKMAVLFSGALGALLSGAVKLKELEKITELKGVWSALFPQIVLGATFAFIAVLILKSGAIAFGGVNFSKPGLTKFLMVGLVSGFSEPFAFGLLERVAGLGGIKN